MKASENKKTSNNENNLNSSLKKTIQSDSLKTFTIENSEILLDSLLNDGLLKDIPVISSINNLYKVGKSIKDYFFLKKLIKFLTQISSIPLEKRVEFISQIDKNKEHAEKTGEQLLFIIERMNSVEKAQIIGQLFKSCILNEIDYKDFIRISQIIDRMFLDDLNLLVKFEAGQDIEIFEKNKLAYLELIDNLGISGKTYLYTINENTPPRNFIYKTSKFGKILIEKLGLKKYGS